MLAYRSVLCVPLCLTKTNCKIGLRAYSQWHSKPARRAISIVLSASRKGHLTILDHPSALERLGTQSGEKVIERH